MLSLTPQGCPHKCFTCARHTLADYLLRLEVPFDSSDLSENCVFDAEQGLLNELDSSQV